MQFPILGLPHLLPTSKKAQRVNISCGEGRSITVIREVEIVDDNVHQCYQLVLFYNMHLCLQGAYSL